MKIFRGLLLPLSLLYGIIVTIRNFLYDKKIITSHSFGVPILKVGNLTTGGTGKTPHVEYLIRLLQHEFRIATLSRGYGRRTKGFIEAKLPSGVEQIGDEPMQYLTKFRNIVVTVCEDRSFAISNLLRRENSIQAIILDDAFQHRKVASGLNILLIDYDRVFKYDFILPTGNLREPRSSRKRANVIIITNSPSILVSIERKRILDFLNPNTDQLVFFSFVKYGEFVKLFGDRGDLQMGSNYYLEKRFTLLLVTGIANPSGLVEYLRRQTDKLELMQFPDHHQFSKKDLIKIQQTFDNIANPSKIIVTTEKDAMRLKNSENENIASKLPFFYIPIEIQIHQEEEKFNNMIIDYVRKNQSNNSFHSR